MNKQKPRIALCHEWASTYGGSEQVASCLAEALAVKDVYVFIAEPALAASLFPAARVHVVGRWGRDLARDHWQWFLPAMPATWSRVDLGGYDLVITSSHACTNAIRVPAGVPHISYCHTPMRYAWQWRSEINRFPPAFRPIWPAVAALFRKSDRAWSQRVTEFIVNSKFVGERVRRFYGRDSRVIYPPVDTSFWTPGTLPIKDDFFLFVGRMVAYKRPDLALEASRMAGVKIVFAGSGPMLPFLRNKAAREVEFVENPTRETLRDLYRRARALLCPGVEDFGMTSVEAQACGTPVIALNEGGAREAILNGRTGLLYEGRGAGDLARAIGEFSPAAYGLDEMVAHAATFDLEMFKTSVRQAVDVHLGRLPMRNE